ncbi:MAG: ribonuclease protein component [Pseudomonadota bacterium]|jgi:ribonuclease P protein component
MTLTAEVDKSQKPFGFSALQRLKKPQEFQLVRQSGKRFRSVHFLLNAVSTEQRQTRLGVSVSKKYVRLAVDRNKIKRLVREYFRIHQHQLPSTDISVAVLSKIKKPSLENMYTKLQDEFTHTWNKAVAVLTK